MRILHIDTGRDMRGGQHQALLLINALREAGHECELLAAEGSPLWRAGIGANLKVGVAAKGSVRNFSKNVDLVHAHDAGAHTLAALASKRPFVVARRVAFPIKTGVLSRWKYSRARHYLPVSEFVAGQLRAAKIPDSKIQIVYDAVPPLPASEPWDPEFPAVTLASADPQKGRALVESAARLSGVEVVFSDDLLRDLKRASMFVYITRSEGLGSAALIAMQMGVPVIASAVEGMRELFTDNVSGLYVKNEPGDIMRAMRRILASRTLATTLMEGAKARVAEVFTVDHMVHNTLAAYGRALGS